MTAVFAGPLSAQPATTPGFLPAGFIVGSTGPSANGAVAFDLLYLHTFVLPEPVTVTTLFAKVATIGTTSNVKLGLWRAGGGRAVGTPIASNNTGVATTATGIVSLSVGPAFLPAGCYWAGSMHGGGAVPTMLCLANSAVRPELSLSTAAASLLAGGVSGWVTGFTVPAVYATDIGGIDLTPASYTAVSGSVLPIVGMGMA